ncbi:hypothetical protein JXA48_01970 [Candidatus Woesearchaeota archaeon]|nr:hypothetical protein [Candidatus Woesearchaeota archaeon]
MIFAPITTATQLGNSSNQTYQYSNLTLSPILGMVVDWPTLNNALNNNELEPTQIILNNTNQTVMWSSSGTLTTTSVEEILASIENYESLTYYVDYDQRILLNQPSYVITTEDVYVPLTTDLKKEIFKDGNTTLEVSLIENETQIVIEANFSDENGLISGLNSFCELRENSTGQWDSNFMNVKDVYFYQLAIGDSFMYEVTCQDLNTEKKLSAVSTYQKNIVSSGEGELQSKTIEEEFDLGDNSKPILVEDLYINLTDDYFNNADTNVTKPRENKTSLDVTYVFDDSNVVLSAEYLNSDGTSLVGLNSFCEIRENSTNVWSSPYYLFYDDLVKKYQTSISKQNDFWAQVSCFTNNVGEENLSTIKIIETKTNKIEESYLSEELIGFTNDTNHSSQTRFGIFNLETPSGIISDFTVDEDLNIAFRIDNLTHGQKLSVDLTLPIPIPQNQHIYIWKKLSGTYKEVPYDISDSRKKLTLHLQDGLIDDDEEVNGVIVDPFQLIFTDESTEVTATSSQSSLIALESNQLDVVINKGVLGEVLVVDPNNLPVTPLPPRSFVTNLLKLNISSFDSEGVDVTFKHSGPLVDPVVWKFNPNKFEWYVMPHTRIDDSTISIHIVDGGLGDDDGLKNGVIIDDVGIVQSETRLNISDDSDAQTILQNETIGFYANYTNATSDAPYLGANCVYAENITGTWNASSMTYNLTSGLYEYYSNFSNFGTYYYKINCSQENATTIELNETFTISRTPLATDANYSSFSGSTTEFNLESDISNVSGAIIENVGFGKIEWNNPINATSQDFNNNIVISNNYVFVNSSALNSNINSSANVTMSGLTWTIPIIYRDGVECSTCNVLSYSAGTLVFNVTGFSTYTTGPQTNLSINDTTDITSRYEGQNITFYAYYTNITSGLPITGAGSECNFTENSSGSWSADQTMSYNNNGYYELNKTFATNGTFNFNVSCVNTQGYANLTTTDTFTVEPRPTRELYITDVTYSNNNPNENELVTVTVNMSNIETANATNFTVEMNVSLWNGTDKIYVGTNTSLLVDVNASSWNTVDFTWNASLGLTIFDFYIDTQNNVTELDETNNIFTKNISTNSWVTFYGNLSTNVVLGDSSNKVMKNWTATPWGVMLVSDVDASYVVGDLVALDATGDLAKLDIALKMTGFEDSISKLYDSNDDGDADLTTTINLVGNTINNVPAYKIGSSDFITGILYDSSDGAPYDGSQDVVFVVEINSTGTGAYANVDYELYFPALLRSSKVGSDIVEYQINFD